MSDVIEKASELAIQSISERWGKLEKFEDYNDIIAGGCPFCEEAISHLVLKRPGSNDECEFCLLEPRFCDKRRDNYLVKEIKKCVAERNEREFWLWYGLAMKILEETYEHGCVSYSTKIVLDGLFEQ